jgi:phenylacetate-CoA ligase
MGGNLEKGFRNERDREPRPPFFHPIEGRPWKEVQALQEELLRKEIAYILEGSEFYREHWKKCSALSSRIHSKNDLAKLPFTEKKDLKEDLRKHPPLGSNLIVPLSKITRFASTSGTTGTPYYHAVTAQDYRMWLETTARCFYGAGFTPGRDIGIYVGAMANMFAVGIYMSGTLEYMGIPAFLPGVEAGSERTLRLIHDQGIITALYGFPNYVLYLGSQSEKVLGIPACRLGIRKIAVGGEPGVRAMREALQSTWGAKAYESMGISEVGMMFSECSEQNGMHWIAQEFLLPEIIHPETAEVLPLEKGVEGELVVTSLSKEANPLIRYRTKDMVRVIETTCTCGRTSPKMIISGRVDDMLIVKGQKVWPNDIKGVVMTFRPQVTGEIRIVLDSPEYSFSHPVQVKVELSQDLDPQAKRTLKEEIEKKIRSWLVVRAEVHLVPQGSLPAKINIAGKMSLFEKTYGK